MTEPVDGFDAVRLRADNPGPMTLDGTNTWVLGRDPCWIVDPGPDLAEHLDAVAAEAHARGGAGGIALTHGHADHTDGVAGLVARLGGGGSGGGADAGGGEAAGGAAFGDAATSGDASAAGGSARGAVPVGALGWSGRTVDLADSERFGPLEVLALPGHADDHVVFLWGGLCCAGDAVLGAGSVFVAGDMAGYLAGLERLRSRAPAVICPGHGPIVTGPDAKLAEYVAHRLDRESRLSDALAAGARGDDALLDAAWSDVPPGLRPAAALTMHAHLRKLAAEGRLPADVAPPPVDDLPSV